ncbi:hypothetical protein NC651_018404 [Populus alba x Populus x berolinensis]|nr:hypothetical protein NC651_018404 [Populus alba x Populus x berolinensis]
MPLVFLVCFVLFGCALLVAVFEPPFQGSRWSSRSLWMVSEIWGWGASIGFLCSRALPACSLGCCWPVASCCCLGAFVHCRQAGHLFLY